MSDLIKLVQGDSRPSLVVTLTDERSGNALNLTDTTPVLKFRAEGADVLIGEVTGVVIDPVNGICVFRWSTVPGILDVEEGVYEGEIEIRYLDGTIQTVYGTLYFYLRAQF